jgi:hypothetical protein
MRHVLFVGIVAVLVIAACASAVPTVGPASLSPPSAAASPSATRIATSTMSCDLASAECPAGLTAIPATTPPPTPIPSSNAAAAQCQLALDHPDLADVRVNSGESTLSGAFLVTLEQWTTWEEKVMGGRRGQPLENPGKLVAACFIDGDFTAQTSGMESDAERHRTRIVVVVYDGFVEPHMYGTKESIQVEDPATATRH